MHTSKNRNVEVDVSNGDALLTVNPSLEQDMTSLWYLHEPGILRNLNGRFELDEPYTSVAHLLIAVNPLKPLPSPEMSNIAAAQSTSSLAPVRARQGLRKHQCYRVRSMCGWQGARRC